MLFVLPFILLATTLLKRKPGKLLSLFLLRIWASFYSYLSFTKIIKINKPVYEDKAVIYVCNHSSFLDAITVAKSLRGAYSPLGKVEMAKIPIFGWIYSKVVVLINRKDQKSRETSVLMLKKELDAGISIFIFPEGTMNRTSEIMGSFFNGAFRIAIETQTPIQAMIIRNSGKLLPADNILKIKPGTIEVEFSPIIPSNNLTIDDVDLLSEKVRGIMLNMLTKEGTN